MSSPLNTIKREVRVAFSTKAQPVWFRFTKWIVFVTIARRLYGTKWFGISIAGGAIVGITLHFVYRWKTQGWTKAWGGWNDAATADPKYSRI
jgi:hypothetical protein